MTLRFLDSVKSLKTEAWLPSLVFVKNHISMCLFSKHCRLTLATVAIDECAAAKGA